MPSFAHAGGMFHFEAGGSGLATLALPGMLSDSASWGPLVPLLEPHMRLIRPDPRCTGRSPSLPTSVAAMVTDSVALMDHLGFDRPHVISHSMGSRVAIELAAQHPDRVAKLVVAGVLPSFPRLNCAVFETLLAIRQANGGDLWLRALFPWLFARAFFDDPSRVEDALAASTAYPFAQSVEDMARQVEALTNAPPPPRLSTVTAPTLALFGVEDRLVPIAEGPDALRDIPDLTVKGVDGAAHALHWDQPGAVSQAILDFLAG